MNKSPVQIITNNNFIYLTHLKWMKTDEKWNWSTSIERESNASNAMGTVIILLLMTQKKKIWKWWIVIDDKFHHEFIEHENPVISMSMKEPYTLNGSVFCPNISIANHWWHSSFQIYSFKADNQNLWYGSAWAFNCNSRYFKYAIFLLCPQTIYLLLVACNRQIAFMLVLNINSNRHPTR